MNTRPIPILRLVLAPLFAQPEGDSHNKAFPPPARHERPADPNPIPSTFDMRQVFASQ